MSKRLIKFPPVENWIFPKDGKGKPTFDIQKRMLARDGRAYGIAPNGAWYRLPAVWPPLPRRTKKQRIKLRQEMEEVA